MLRALPHAEGDIIAGRYRLVSPLGQGGMGAVWRAESLSLGVEVALKLLRVGAGGDDAERLLREARAAATIGHPSIVHVLDCGVTESDEPFLVMELLRGESLDRRLTALGRLPSTTAVELMLPIASALAAAHARGVVHRDIKPENIVLVEGEGELVSPTLVDFGIAKLSEASSNGRVLTESGALLGSPGYMSPEQAHDTAEVDARTDVWSFSVVLYELVVGKRPFDSPNISAVLLAIFRDDPTPITARMAGDEELWAIIERGLRKSPAERWPGMRELGQALARWAIARGVVTDAAGVSIERQWLGARPGSSPDLRVSSAPSDRRPSGSAPEVPVRTEPVTLASAPVVSPPLVPPPPSGSPHPPHWASEISRPRRNVVAMALSGLALSTLLGLAAWRGAVTAAGDAPPTSPAAVATVPAPLVLAETPEIEVTPVPDKPAADAHEAPAPTVTAPARIAPGRVARRASMPLPSTPDF